MKVEVNETLLKEFGRVYNAWNKEHGMEPVLDTRALTDMAIAKAVMGMRDRIEADTERGKDSKHQYIQEVTRFRDCLQKEKWRGRDQAGIWRDGGDLSRGDINMLVGRHGASDTAV